MERYHDRTMIEPIVVTCNDHDRLVVLSEAEYLRLKRLDRESLPLSALSGRELDELLADTMSPEYDHLDTELSS